MRSFVARFIPRYFASWPLRYIVPGSKFRPEVSLENLCRLEEEEKENTSDATSECQQKQQQLFHWCGILNASFFIFY